MKRFLSIIMSAVVAASVSAAQLPDWLKEGLIYHIYPSTYADSNGDGIGDLNGIRQHLGYIKSLDVNTIWLSPCFCSDFKDGGYDITDYYRIDPRFGTNDDAVALISEAHEMGIHVLFDLVAGHTSIKHPWFAESALAENNLQHSDYYIWIRPEDMSSKGVRKAVKSNFEREGYYIMNYYDIQPALNYGYANPDPNHPWEQSMNAPGPQAVRREIKNIIAFWLGKGLDGFRCDMANSLVKGDDKRNTANCALWHEIIGWMNENYPGTILMSEWADPEHAIVDGGFHVDLIMHNRQGVKLYRPLVYQTNHDGSQVMYPYFSKDGKGDIREWVSEYTRHLNATRGIGMASMPTCSHDIWRMNRFDRNTPDQLKVTMTFFMTLEPTPILYYGEEIGMRNLEDAPDKEGSLNVKNRSSCRTPMQWDGSENAGFSTAPADRLYLPVDPSPAKPNVAAQEEDPNSLLNYTRGLIALRNSTPALGTQGVWNYISDPAKPYPMVYERVLGDERYVVILNPRGSKAVTDIPALAGRKLTPVYGTYDRLSAKITAKGLRLTAPAVSAVICKVE